MAIGNALGTILTRVATDLLAEDLTAFSGMTSLESLSLASPRIETCAGVEALTGLTFLGLYVTSRLTTLEGIETLTKLVQLEVNDCPKVDGEDAESPVG